MTQVKLVKSFCYLGGRLNASRKSEVLVTARTRIGWIKFTECGKLFNGRKLSLKMKGWIYRRCLRLVMLNSGKAMMKAMCGIKLLEKRSSQERIDLLDLEEALDRLAKAN